MRVTGIEPALSAWEVCGAVDQPPADSVTCGDLGGLSLSGRDYPRALLAGHAASTPSYGTDQPPVIKQIRRASPAC
jgi:hypothetical protein